MSIVDRAVSDRAINRRLYQSAMACNCGKIALEDTGRQRFTLVRKVLVRPDLEESLLLVLVAKKRLSSHEIFPRERGRVGVGV